MKRSIIVFILSISFIVLNYSCGEDKTNPISILTSKFEAKIDSEDFVATTKFYNDNTGRLIITGQRLEGGSLKDEIIITVPSLETGSYTIGLDSIVNIVTMNYHVSDSSNIFTGYSGNITINEIKDNKISGVFAFQASTISLSTVQITDGVFEDVPKVGND